MNDSERIRDEIITILVLIVTLVVTSSNLNPQSLEDQSLADRLPQKAAIN